MAKDIYSNGPIVITRFCGGKRGTCFQINNLIGKEFVTMTVEEFHALIMEFAKRRIEKFYPKKEKTCRFCGQPMKPKGVKKLPNEYDHARGCPYNKNLLEKIKTK